MRPGYPTSTPLQATLEPIPSVSSETDAKLTGKVNESLRLVTAMHANDRGEALWETITFAREELSRSLGDSAFAAEMERSGEAADDTHTAAAASLSPSSTPASYLLFIHIDHMHDRRLYTRNIRTMVSDATCTGRLIFYNKLILLVLHGSRPALRSYLKRHRTETVDIDSRGRACRERMMNVLIDCEGQEPLVVEEPFPDYREVEATSFGHVRAMCVHEGRVPEGVLRGIVGGKDSPGKEAAGSVG